MTLFRNPLSCALVLWLSLLACVGADPRSNGHFTVAQRVRVIIDNDFGGDPDGLFQLAQHLLSPSVDVRAVIGSRNYSNGFYGRPGSSEYACTVAKDLLKAMDLKDVPPVLAGAEISMESIGIPAKSAGAEFIVSEAMRSDANSPLYVVCGASLTTVASAYLMEPKIAARLRVIWIGGPEYADLALPPPGNSGVEYNLGIDLKAAQVVFNDSDIPLWQVPRDVYRQPLISLAELTLRVRPQGRVGAFLANHLEELLRRAKGELGEVYALGDSPLVLLTALQSSWEMDPSSSKYVNRSAPMLTAQGLYEANPKGRTIRIYTQVDVRLLFEDLFAKLAVNAVGK